jgi:hypothetical protein
MMHVVEVSYETHGPKGFDDVVVRYNPGMASRKPFRTEAAHHQVKYHVTMSTAAQTSAIGRRKSSHLALRLGHVGRA